MFDQRFTLSDFDIDSCVLCGNTSGKRIIRKHTTRKIQLKVHDLVLEWLMHFWLSPQINYGTLFIDKLHEMPECDSKTCILKLTKIRRLSCPNEKQELQVQICFGFNVVFSVCRSKNWWMNSKRSSVRDASGKLVWHKYVLINAQLLRATQRGCFYGVATIHNVINSFQISPNI